MYVIAPSAETADWKGPNLTEITIQTAEQRRRTPQIELK